MLQDGATNNSDIRLPTPEQAAPVKRSVVLDDDDRGEDSKSRRVEEGIEDRRYTCCVVFSPEVLASILISHPCRRRETSPTQLRSGFINAAISGVDVTEDIFVTYFDYIRGGGRGKQGPSH